MSCTSPLLAVDYGYKSDGVTRWIKILPRRVDYSFQDMKNRYGDSLLMLPCGKCDSCIMARRKLWALRCYAESLYHQENCFVTLTYDDDHLPFKLDKSHFQLFIKSLRNYGVKVRYYGCGEYGGQTGRPHYHIILFGFFPNDVKPFSKTKSGFWQYSSSFLSSLWNKGFVTVSEFSPEVAGYVAGYVDKKYKMQDCFTLMSKRPGLGEQYFKDHYQEFYKTGSLVVNYGSHVAHVPRYFDKLAEKIGFDISDVKDNRIIQANQMMYQMMRDLKTPYFEVSSVHQEWLMKNKLNFKKRGL